MASDLLSGETPAGNDAQSTAPRRISFLSSSDGAPAVKRRSSFLQKARHSISRRKNNATDPETLRGTSGADFEGYATVIRGSGSGIGCGCCGGEGDSRKVRYLLIKGASCFVYISENGLSPKYAISLAKINAKYEQKVHQGTTTVYLQTSLGDIEYTMIFDTRESDEIAATFLDVVNEQARVAQAELISKRLGHGHLGERKASVIFADTLAKEKVKNQPDKPVTAAEILDATPGARNGGLTL